MRENDVPGNTWSKFQPFYPTRTRPLPDFYFHTRPKPAWYWKENPSVEPCWYQSFVNESHVAHYLAKNTGWVNRSNFYKVGNSPWSKVRAPHCLVTPKIRKRDFLVGFCLFLCCLYFGNTSNVEEATHELGRGLEKGWQGLSRPSPKLVGFSGIRGRGPCGF